MTDDLAPTTGVETALVLSRLECTAAGRAALDEANT